MRGKRRKGKQRKEAHTVDKCGAFVSSLFALHGGLPSWRRPVASKGENAGAGGAESAQMRWERAGKGRERERETRGERCVNRKSLFQYVSSLPPSAREKTLHVAPPRLRHTATHHAVGVKRGGRRKRRAGEGRGEERQKTEGGAACAEQFPHGCPCVNIPGCGCVPRFSPSAAAHGSGHGRRRCCTLPLRFADRPHALGRCRSLGWPLQTQEGALVRERKTRQVTVKFQPHSPSVCVRAFFLSSAASSICALP